MTEIEKYVKFVQRWEGKHGRSTNDSSSSFTCPTPFQGKTGWHTSSGITYRVWVAEYGTTKDKEFFSMPFEMWWKVFKKRFFDKVQADKLTSFKVAALLVDAGWMSGNSVGVKMLQRACNNLGSTLEVDGEIGNKTITAANSHNPDKLFTEMYKLRSAFYTKIAVGNNAVFLKGWMNRLNSLRDTF